MILVFDLYEQDPTSNGDPEFVASIEHEASNSKHFLDYLIGFASNNEHYIIRNMRVWG
jgi:hypothetical protein